MKRVYSWDNLKFFAMLCVLVLHSTIPYSKDGMQIIKYLWPFINLYPMTLFTIISGFWYKDRSLKELVLLFLWPCLLFTLINGIFGWVFYPNYINAFMFRPGYAMWYLMAIFIYNIITKLIRCRVGNKVLFLLSLVIAILIGFMPIPNKFFEIQRISCLFPVFVYGLLLKEHTKGKSIEEFQGRRSRIICLMVLLSIIFFNIASIHFFPSQQGSLVDYYGLNIKVALIKWFFIIIRVVACTCIIVMMPNKEYWFTKYGARTMNVYLLHIIPIFVICWGCLYNYRYEWYGLVSLFLGVPLLCTLFFSIPIDRIMKKILFTDKIKMSR